MNLFILSGRPLEFAPCVVRLVNSRDEVAMTSERLRLSKDAVRRPQGDSTFGLGSWGDAMWRGNLEKRAFG